MSTDTAKLAGIYLRAADMIASRDVRGCCDALGLAEGETHPTDGAGCCLDVVAKAFSDMFRPPEVVGFWWGDTFDTEEQNQRTLALCFMAAMVEAGDA